MIPIDIHVDLFATLQILRPSTSFGAAYTGPFDAASIHDRSSHTAAEHRIHILARTSTTSASWSRLSLLRTVRHQYIDGGPGREWHPRFICLVAPYSLCQGREYPLLISRLFGIGAANLQLFCQVLLQLCGGGRGIRCVGAFDQDLRYDKQS
jgi:hypothetical protein